MMPVVSTLCLPPTRPVMFAPGLGRTDSDSLCPRLDFRVQSRPPSRKLSVGPPKRTPGKRGRGRNAPPTTREPRRRREARRSARAKASLASVPYITREIPLTEVVSEEGAPNDRGATPRPCSSTSGIEFRDFPRALELFRNAGCDMGANVSAFLAAWRKNLYATAPSRYVQHARNPDRNVTIGGDAIVFAPNYGSPFSRPRQGPPAARASKTSRTSSSSPYLEPLIHHSGGLPVCGARSIYRSTSGASRWCSASGKCSDKPFHGLRDQARARRGQRAHLRASVRRRVRAPTTR